MRWFRDTLGLYADVFGRGLDLFAKNPILILPVVATLGVRLLWPLLAPLGFAGGLVMVVLESMCWSALLATTGDAIRTRRVNAADVRAGFVSYLGDVLNVRFVIFILGLVLSFTPPSPLHVLIPLAMFVFFNAVPELIYLGRHGTADLFAASYRFMGQHWIEWVPPNVLLVVLVGAVMSGLPPVVVPALGSALGSAVVLVALASMVASGMLIRGILFQELTGSSRRARAFRRRAS